MRNGEGETAMGLVYLAAILLIVGCVLTAILEEGVTAAGAVLLSGVVVLGVAAIHFVRSSRP